MHTILGANGAIANGIAKELHNHNINLRLVSRNPKRIHDNDELVSADLLNAEQVMNAVKGSEVVYLTPGLTYNIKVWQDQWPRLMQNVINACKAHGAKLVFFDNVYAYGLVNGWMTEETPLNPVSKKGAVRKQLAEMLMAAQKEGLPVIIARSADFYGAASPISFMNVLVFEKIAKRQKPMLMASADKKHSLTYIDDAGKATAMLGMSDTSWNQVWHVPTADNPLTSKEMIAIAAELAGVKAPGYTLLSKWMIKLIGIFMPVLKESYEMLYQNEYDYLFDSSKFNNAFHFDPTPYRKGIEETLKSYGVMKK